MEIKEKLSSKPFYFKVITRIAKVAVVFALSIFLIFTTAIHQLEENGIGYDSLKISLPFEVEVSGVRVHLAGFNLDVESVLVDLSFSDLITGSFTGKSCHIKGGEIEVYPTYEDEDSEPFTYASIPIVTFSDLLIEDVNIKIGTDTSAILMRFPHVHASNFVLNDSIIADALEYSQGRITLPIAEATTEESVATEIETKFEVPEYIPKFDFGKLVIDSLTFISQGIDSDHKFSGVNLDIDGCSNLAGADINLNAFQFDYQDTIHAAFNKSAMNFVTDNSLLIEDLNLDLPGLALRLNTFSIDKQDEDYSYVLKLNETRISPSLIKAFIPDDELIQASSPDLVLSADLTYQKDSLLVHSISTKLGNESGFTIKGFASDLWNMQEMKLEISDFNLSSADVTRSVNYDLSENFNRSKANLTLTAEGNKDQLQFLGACNFDDVHADLTAELNDIFTEDLTGTVSLQSPYVSSDAFMEDAENDFKAHGFSIRSEINESNEGKIGKMVFHLHSDSLIHQDYRMKDFELDANYLNGLTTVFLGAVDQSWRVQLSTRDNPFESDEIRFKGNTVLTTLDLGSTKLVNGKMTSDIQGKFKFTENVVAISCDLNDVNYKSHGTRSRVENWIKLNYTNKKGKHNVELHDKNSIDLTAEFNDDLFEWLMSEDLSASEIPDFKLECTSTIDSNFVRNFAGLGAGADIQSIKVEGKNNSITGNIDAPYFSYESNEIQKLKVKISIDDSQKIVEVTSDSVLTDYANLGQISTNIYISDDYKDFDINLDAFAEEVQKRIQLNSNLAMNDDAFDLTLDPQEDQQFGSSSWKSKTYVPLQLRREDNVILGEIDFYSKDQSIKVNMTEEFAKVNISKLDLGAVIEKAISDGTHIESVLNFNLSYNYANSVLKGKGAIDEIVFDSISIGSINIVMDANNSSQKANLHYAYLNGALDVNVHGYYSDGLFDIEFKELDFANLVKDFQFLPKEYDLKGKLNGKVSGVVAADPLLNGYLQIDSTSFLEREHGISATTSGEKTWIKNNFVKLNKFRLNDPEMNPVFVDGSVNLMDPSGMNFELNTDRFMVLNNLTTQADLKGKLGVKSTLKLKHEKDIYKVSGFVNTLSGNRIEYLYVGDVELDDMSNTVAFIPFNSPSHTPEVVEETDLGIPLQYNIDLNIGNTDLYVLLSKGKNEYFQVTCTGALKVMNGQTDYPDVSGSIQSSEGNIYYETPMVSKVEMKIREASATWNGDLFNPELFFLGEETFWATPNEMSSELSNNSKRVPVIVEVAIKNKKLDNFDLEFDIRSDDQSVQGILAPLTEETRSAYAMNMMVYGRINTSGNEDPYLGYQQIVDKLNEISRRNFKNTELAFYISSDSKDVTEIEDLYNNLGYHFSKKLLNDNLKITIGGSLDLGNSGESNSELLEKIKVEYNLLAKPEINLELSRDNTYKGPIDGQVDQSSVGVSFNLEFDNLFTRKNKENKGKKGK